MSPEQQMGISKRKGYQPRGSPVINPIEMAGLTSRAVAMLVPARPGKSFKKD